MISQIEKHNIEYQENAIIRGVIIKEPHIAINQEDQLSRFSWMHIREDSGIECEVIITGNKLSKYCKEHEADLDIGKRIKLRGMLSEGKGMDYMYLDNYGEITICEE